jgi:hypothetical protein
MEERKEGAGMSLFGDFFRDWENKMFEDYTRIEKELNQRFKEFEERMNQNR